MRLRPNAPRMITVLAAVALLIVGLAGSGVLPWDLLAIPQVHELMVRFGIVITRQAAYLCLVASPMLLVIGSLLPGI